MKAIDFKEKNIDIAKDQPQYLTLPAFRNDRKKGRLFFA